MSSFDRSRMRAAPLLALALLGLGACTAGPLYGTPAADPLAPAASSPSPLRGRVTVSPADNRTEQILRNELIFRLNGGAAVVAPAYELRVNASGAATALAIQTGSGAPSASTYTMRATYALVRTADGAIVARGRRTSTARFDRTGQIYAATQALEDAVRQAAGDVAAQVELAVAAAARQNQL